MKHWTGFAKAVTASPIASHWHPVACATGYAACGAQESRTNMLKAEVLSAECKWCRFVYWVVHNVSGYDYTARGGLIRV